MAPPPTCCRGHCCTPTTKTRPPSSFQHAPATQNTRPPSIPAYSRYPNTSSSSKCSMLPLPKRVLPLPLNIPACSHHPNACSLLPMFQHAPTTQTSPTSTTPRPPSHVVDDDYDEGITELLLTLSHYHVPEMQVPSTVDSQNGQMHSPSTVSNGSRHSATSLEYLTPWLCLIFTQPSFSSLCSRLIQSSSESNPGNCFYILQGSE
jgi:hypothetical protein